ncbi:MAG: triphosphoribosyl-dephospho-CoA synthase [Pirellulales bacterium]
MFAKRADNRHVCLTTGQCAALACLLEVSAPKPGNVWRGADFADMTFLDLAVSGVALVPVIDRATERPVGETILAAVEAMRASVGTNTHLGSILLIAPLAAVPRDEKLVAGLPAVLASLSVDDARHTYQAIRLAQPGGMGQVDQADLADDPDLSLVACMALASDRDLVARQYTEGFSTVIDLVVPSLEKGVRTGQALEDAIVLTALRLLAEYPDSLIARKCGPDAARQTSGRAAHVLDAGQPGETAFQRALSDLDFWLRSDGNRRNPGTTADLITAGLFVMLREGRLDFPLRWL